jgi:hypothetical protein
MEICVAVTKMYRLFSTIFYYKKNVYRLNIGAGQVLGVVGELSSLGSSAELGW